MAKLMTKAEIVSGMAKAAGITAKQAQVVLESLIAACRNEVKSGRPFRVAGLGTFNLRKSKARQGRNPATGAPIKIAASKRMAFTASSAIKSMLNPK